VELREVEVFLTLAAELHFGRTAERLHLSQGRVSQLIRALEREVGGALFERSSRSVRLTALGASFQVEARAGYDQLGTALRNARATARGVAADLQVSYMPAIGSDLIARTAALFEQDQPGCRLIVSATVEYPVDARGVLPDSPTDVCLMWTLDGLPQIPGRSRGPVVRRVRRGVMVPADHRLARRESIELEDLAGELLLTPSKVWATDYLDRWIPPRTPSGREIRRTEADVPELTGSADLVLQNVPGLVARGHGLHCTVVTALDVTPYPGVTMVPITDLPPALVVPVWETSAENAMIRAFVAAAVRAADTH
jgi:DNA-binding transcriptional LysR family regulator